MNILINSFEFYKDHKATHPDHKFKELVEDLRKKMKESNSPLERKDLAKKIAAIDSMGKTQLDQLHLALTMIAVVKFVSGHFVGAIGAGVSTFALHDYEQSLKDKNQGVKKAKMVGGKRVDVKGKHDGSHKSSRIKDASQALAMGILPIGSIASNILKDLSSYVFKVDVF